MMGGDGISAIRISEGDGVGRITRAVSQAMAVPLPDISDISTTYGVLIHIAGGEDMTLEEVAAVGELIMDKVPDTRRVIWVPGWTALLLAECASWCFSQESKTLLLKASRNKVTTHTLRCASSRAYEDWQLSAYTSGDINLQSEISDVVGWWCGCISADAPQRGWW